MKATSLPALADDSGLCVGALQGAPGIHSARLAGPSKDFAGAMAEIRDAAEGLRHAPGSLARPLQRDPRPPLAGRRGWPSSRASLTD